MGAAALTGVSPRQFPLFKELLYNQDDVDLLPMWNRPIKASI